MLLPCEVAVRCLLPSVRAMLAKELMAKHDVNQAEVAKLLGVSQPAISLYCREMRGKTINLENDRDIQILIAQLAELLANGNLSHKEFIPKFCEICKTIRAKGLLCQMHKAFDPSIDVENCELCSLTSSMRCP
jgi:predicted transcriptional regulator